MPLRRVNAGNAAAMAAPRRSFRVPSALAATGKAEPLAGYGRCGRREAAKPPPVNGYRMVNTSDEIRRWAA